MLKSFRHSPNNKRRCRDPRIINGINGYWLWWGGGLMLDDLASTVGTIKWGEDGRPQVLIFDRYTIYKLFN